MEPVEHTQETHPAAIAPVVLFLERLDNVFHVIVAILFILMAATVLIHTCVAFAQQAPHVFATSPVERRVIPAPDPAETGKAAHEAPATESAVAVDPFLHNSLEILSSILFVVIILELLRTILTYLQTHNIQAIMQEFIVVGIISSVRKILLVGAESSLSGSKGTEFIQEATGTLLSIGGILALILGLVLLQHAYGNKSATK